jgi:hypothetical protein
MTHKYKVGDRVKIRTDLEVDKEYGEDVFVLEMASSRGKILSISRLVEGGYNIEGYSYPSQNLRFTDEMIDHSYPSIIIDVKTLAKLRHLRSLIIDSSNKDIIDSYIAFVTDGYQLTRENKIYCNKLYKGVKALSTNWYNAPLYDSTSY